MLSRARVWAAFLLLAAGASALWADDEYDRLLESYDAAHAKWLEQTQNLKKGKTPPRAPTLVFARKFQSYARKHAGKPAAIPALVWLIEAARADNNDALQRIATWAVDILRRQHAASPALGPVMADLRNAIDCVSGDNLVLFYERVRTKNPDSEVQAAATFNEAYALWIAGSGGRAADKQRADDLFRTVMKDYPASPLAAEAEGFLKHMERFDIGLPAPEIVGTDPSDKEIRLSQFKGRVVAIVFWGFW
jgi:hypothetical protein